MRGIQGIGNWVLIIMTVASLISMIAALSLEGIISNDLSAYGLQFSYAWAIPYWNTIGIIFLMAWLNIFAAIAFQVYRIRTIRKEERQSAEQQFENTLKSEDEQENEEADEGDRKVYGITITTEQTAQQEATEQVQIVPYEPVICEPIKYRDSKTEE